MVVAQIAAGEELVATAEVDVVITGIGDDDEVAIDDRVVDTVVKVVEVTTEEATAVLVLVEKTEDEAEEEDDG